MLLDMKGIYGFDSPHYDEHHSHEDGVFAYQEIWTNSFG